MNLQIGDVVFVRNSGLLSRTIRRVTDSEWSHVAIYLGEGKVIDTDAFRNVSIHDLSEFETFHVKRYEGLTDQEVREIVSYMVERLNEPYDYWQILGFFLEAVFHYNNAWYMKDKYTCGSLIDRAFLSAGIDLVPWRDTGDVWPEDLFRSPLLV
jgi:uncharacterized protein YycO